MIIAGNWKLNKSPKETTEFLEQLKLATQNLEQGQIIVFPPQVSLYSCSIALHDSAINWGGQNICTDELGAFTGETSAVHLNEMGATYALVGHSERRSIYQETNNDVNIKIKTALKRSLTPVVCVGETLEQRNKNETASVLKEQLKAAFSGLAEVLSPEQFSTALPLMIAYEPVWAIGTGVVATENQVLEAHALIRTELTALFNKSVAEKMVILYGGSVKPQNSKGLALLEGVDGFLIGGASLKIDSFIEVYKNSHH